MQYRVPHLVYDAHAALAKTLENFIAVKQHRSQQWVRLRYGSVDCDFPVVVSQCKGPLRRLRHILDWRSSRGTWALNLDLLYPKLDGLLAEWKAVGLGAE